MRKMNEESDDITSSNKTHDGAEGMEGVESARQKSAKLEIH